MIHEYDKYIEELHKRKYSIYENSNAEKIALKELHDRSYLIFDEEESFNLLADYYDEFDRLKNTVSFVSLQEALKQEKLFQ